LEIVAETTPQAISGPLHYFIRNILLAWTPTKLRQLMNLMTETRSILASENDSRFHFPFHRLLVFQARASEFTAPMEALFPFAFDLRSNGRGISRQSRVNPPSGPTRWPHL
jgi:hypothetical protein